MKTLISILVAAALGFAAAFFLGAGRPAGSADNQKEKAAWEKEKAELEAALEEAKAQLMKSGRISPRAEVVTVAQKESAKDILETLKSLRIAKQSHNVRLAIQQFENLIGLGQEALPEIEGFLSLQEDIEYDASIFGAWKGSKDGNVPTDFVFPPSLRFGLFDVVRQIGGNKAEKILSDALHITGRGVEVAYLTRVLHQVSPFKYRDLAVTAAKDLLASPSNAVSASPLDKYERNYLYGVLAFYNDASLAQEAQAQLLQTDGKVDKSALQYLQKTLGTEVLPTIAQIYTDPRLTDGAQKESLARVALAFAGSDPRADALWRNSIYDQSIPEDARRELIEDLNQDGIDEKNPTQSDYDRMRARLALIAKNSKSTDSKAIADAFVEARNDLLKMLEKEPKP
jgi:hypothetical protein